MQVYTDFSLKDIVYYKIGGTARYVIKIQDRTDLVQALEFMHSHTITDPLSLGLGSNVLLNDRYFDTAVLWFCRPQSPSIQVQKDNLIEAFASNLLDDLIHFTFQQNFVGVAWAGGLPSTIGGAIRGNVGAFGGEIKDSVAKTEVLDLSTQEPSFKTLSNQELEFRYRGSIVKKNKHLVVITGYFLLQKGTDEDIGKAYDEYLSHIEYRNTHHAMEYPSCGSVFKNITKQDEVEKIYAAWGDVKELSVKKWHNKVSMGYVINRLGFSGFTVGGAQVSEKHANYIVNKNNARFSDVVAIIDTIKEKFYQTFGFYPEEEVEIVR